MELDIAMLQELSPAFDPADRPDSSLSILVHATDSEIADRAPRLLRLLERQDAAGALQTSILREVRDWPPAGRYGHGRIIRSIATLGSSVHKIARAVAVLRCAFDQPLGVEGLAMAAGMNPSSLHQHFRQFTSLSPLQFQKQVRLLEARRRLSRDGTAASEAAFQVGDESVSQLTREDACLFGLPPGRDRIGRQTGASRTRTSA